MTISSPEAIRGMGLEELVRQMPAAAVIAEAPSGRLLLANECAYVMGGVLVDAATRHATRRILRRLDGLDVQAHAMFTPDPGRKRASIRRLAALEPAVACFGHGPPWRDTAALQGFAAALPA